MKRVLSLVIAVAAVLGLAAPVGAHNMSLVGAVSLHEGEVTLRVMDIYGAVPPVDNATAAPAAPGKAPGGKAVPLSAAEPGTFVGRVVLAGADRYDIELDVWVVGELYRLRLRDVTPTESRPEALMPMIPIEPLGFSWGPILYAIAVVVVVTATVVALMKRRQEAGEDEEEEVQV